MNLENFEVGEDLMLIKVINEGEKSKNGLIITTSDRSVLSGEVISCNKTVVNYPPGGTVFFYKTAGTEFIINDEDYLIMKQKDVLGYERK